MCGQRHDNASPSVTLSIHLHSELSTLFKNLQFFPGFMQAKVKDSQYYTPYPPSFQPSRPSTPLPPFQVTITFDPLKVNSSVLLDE
jgi:hypothetical protein